MDDLLDEFIAETRDMMETLSGQLVLWERTPEDRVLLDSVFRFVHTVKGSCGFLELPRLLRLSHAAEDILSSVRDEKIKPSAGLVTAVLKIIDRISVLTNALVSGKSVFDDDDQLIAVLPAHLEHECVEAKAPNSPESQPALIESDIVETTDRPHTRTVRVSLALLDKMMNGVSDLVLARNEVSRHIRSEGEDSALDQAFVRLSTSVGEMRNNVSQMRMQNMDRLFSALPRLVRDIAFDLNKKIEVHIEGSAVEIDRDMVEVLRDPLMHILRNAADHGIEGTEERRNAGKDPVGCIRIIASQSGNQIVIEISDDGRGINLEKLRAKAISSKRITIADWNQLPAKSQLAMVFLPGLSTADQVSTISGRGVGMDVVHTNIQSVGGSIDIDSASGLGTKMTLKVPLTLSIISGLSVKAGEQLFGIPRNAVVELLAINNNQVKLETVGGCQIATIRGESMPYSRLETVLGLSDIDTTGEQDRIIVVIKPIIGVRYALDVASVIDHEELVVKPCAPLLMKSCLYAGTSLPDNGRPVLLLDTSGLAAALGIDTLSHHQSEKKIHPLNTEENEAIEVTALLFNRIDGIKNAIRLSAVDKIEDAEATDIHFVGGKMRYQNKTGLFDVFGIATVPSGHNVSMLRLTDGERISYLAIGSVIDIFQITGKITPSANAAQHEGVIQVSGEPVELQNIFQYFENSIIDSKPINEALCFVECAGDGHWERHILAPLLLASGYKVSFDPEEQSKASIVLARVTDDIPLSVSNRLAGDQRVVKLRHNVQAAPSQSDTIYCYDRVGLIEAIEMKRSGVR
jgi:two-component system, chemotaxis family, sensor kinase CheA